MAYTAFLGTKNPTKFETTGKVLEINLLDAQKSKDTRVYPHQIEAVIAVKAKLAEDVKNKQTDPVMVVAPTGSGKSGMITLLPYILQCRKVLILTPSHIISKQLGESFGIFDKSASFFEKIGICPRDAREDYMEHGVILSRGSDVYNSVPNLVIVTAQKFTENRLAALTKKNSNDTEVETVVDQADIFFGKFDTLIVDEAHHYPAETWLNIRKTFMKSKGSTKQLIFLTATPERKFNGKPIDVLPSERIAYTIKREELEGKYIRPLRFKLEQNENKLHSHIKAILEDKKILDPRFCNPNQSRIPQAMILVNNRTEADEWAKTLNKITQNFAVSIHGGAKPKGKTVEFKKGKKYQVAVTCGLLLEGFDNEAVTLCVILRRMDSKVMFSQFIGRCMRLMKFDGESKDKTIGTVLSYPKYNQEEMFKERDSLAGNDPVETKLEEEVYNADNKPITNRSIPQSAKKRSHGTSQKDKKRRRER